MSNPDSTVRVPPPPPRIRPESPISDVDDISEDEARSDISSISNFNDVQETEDKFEAVSDSELLDDSLPLQPKASDNNGVQASSLEDIDSDEDLPDVEAKVGDDGDPEVKHCSPCKLLFAEAAGLEAHNQTERHGFVVSGVQHSGGPHVCTLCWLGFSTSEEVDGHRDSDEHQLEVKNHGIVEENFSPKTEMLIRAKRKLSAGEKPTAENPAKIFKMRGKMSNTLNSAETVESCSSCNLVFKSFAFYKRHLTSECHLKVMAGHTPSQGFSRYDCVQEIRQFCCYLCWKSFSHLSELISHYQLWYHIQNLKKNGVLKLGKDIPPQPLPAAQKSPKNGVKVISLKDFIVLDEVGETDDADSQEISISNCNNFIDELDVVSDEEDAVETTADDINNCSADQSLSLSSASVISLSEVEGDCEIVCAEPNLPETDAISENGDIFEAEDVDLEVGPKSKDSPDADVT